MKMKSNYRYFLVKDKRGLYQIWETNKSKTRERLIYTNENKEYIDKLKEIWSAYTPPDKTETEKEISENDVFFNIL